METKRIGVISDTHGEISGALMAMKKIFPLDFIIHLGDYTEDGQLIEDNLGVPVIGIKGNCDFQSTLPEDRLLEIGDKKIFLTHGHRYDVKWNYHKIFYKALEVQADLVLFGHTHVATRFIEEGIMVMNPGSISKPRGHEEKSFALLEVGTEIVAEILILS